MSQPAARVAARLVWGSIGGLRPNPQELDLIRTGLGGLVLFTGNVGGLAELRDLIRELRGASPGHLHVAVDQEGGHVVRIREPATRFPSAMAIGATRSEQLAFEVARATAIELASFGFDVVFAPDLDLAAERFNPTLGARTFGSDPALVARLGAASVRGYLAGGILPMPKHFPGHGRTPIDSHHALPIVDGDMDQLRALDLPPYVAAIADDAPALMAGHLVHRAVGDDLPATLSSPILRDLLRDELAFDGVLMTDALVMDAFAEGRSIPDAGVDSLRAGADVLMVLDPAAKVIEAVADALTAGRLTERDLAPTIRRLDRYAALAAANLSSARAELPPRVMARHAEVAAEVARRSLTLVGDDGLLPLGPETGVVLVDVATAAVSPIEDPAAVDREATPGWPLAAAIRRRFGRSAAVRVGKDDLAARERALELAASAEVVLLATRDAFAGAGERALVDAIAALGRPTVRLALHSPVDLAVGPPARASIAAYADVPATCAAVADALLRGPEAYPGRLPITLPGPARVEADAAAA